ncbi:hypothetical protein BDQ17DRAFT_1252070 [Cyathus striatus]|nr:hypothetical protein BDQ17DRAFT_1252070 [Cyathus striatus]
MVKRAKSPDLIDDAKYLICHHPWPHNANWELSGDYIRFCRWLACVVGPDALFAFHYKPAARGTVLIEIDKLCPELELLLGEHRWIEFLKRPSEEEKRLEDNSSKIFYSIYPSAREAQKDGWKRVHIESAWFKEWSPKNPFIHVPYPLTNWCPPPQEDQTNKPLSRPLPGSVKPPPPKAPTPVVGSNTWVSTKMAPAPSQAAIQGAWAQGINSVATANSNGNGSNNGSPGPSPTKWKGPPAGASRMDRRRNEHRPLRFSFPIPPRPTRPNSPHALRTPGIPGPGLSRVSTSAAPTGSSNIRTLTETFVGVSLSPSQEKQLYAAAGMFHDDEAEGGEGVLDPDVLEVTVLAPWEKNEEAEGGAEDLWGVPGAADVYEGASGSGEVFDNLWGEDDVVKKPDQILCPTHGIVCKKGICQDMSKLLRKQEANERGKQRGPNTGRKAAGTGAWKKGVFFFLRFFGWGLMVF